MVNEAPIIIKRSRKKAAHAHHGGAWKIAYSDFVTAMMAFFLLMWLTSSVSEEQLAGIAEYFSKNTTDSLISGSENILGETILGQGGITSELGTPEEEMTEEEAREFLAEQEQKVFEETKAEIEEMIKNDKTLLSFIDNLVIDNTPEGMRIQLIDQENSAMFPSGSAVMTDIAHNLMQSVYSVIKKLPQQISIEGNTDAAPFLGREGYGNWELSADRALASRRKFIELGCEKNRIVRVSGRADTDLYDKKNPNSPNNRRISIILLRNYQQPDKKSKKPLTPKEKRDPFIRFKNI